MIKFVIVGLVASIVSMSVCVSVMNIKSTEIIERDCYSKGGWLVEGRCLKEIR